jgi:hypothetical protein
MKAENYRLRVSNDIVGVTGPQWMVKEVYDAAGYVNYGVETIGFPLFSANLLIHSLANVALPYPWIGLHARTGQMNRPTWRQNSNYDKLILGLAEPMLPDLTYESDVWTLTALAKLGQADAERYFLIHETEIDSRATLNRYAEVFKRNEFSGMNLYIENSPLPNSMQRTIKKVRMMQDLGVEKVGAVGDSVHYGRGEGVAMSDIVGWQKIWGEMIRLFDKAEIKLLHFSDGIIKSDSHDVLAMGREKAMLQQLGEFRKAKDIPLLKECQHGILGVKDVTAEIERQRTLGAIELEAGLIDEAHFKER